jgi:hypothetical protein
VNAANDVLTAAAALLVYLKESDIGINEAREVYSAIREAEGYLLACRRVLEVSSPGLGD